MTSLELENRLIDFAVGCIKLTKSAIKSFASEHMNSQLIRSSTSSALNYSESIGASSYRDYINKMQICLKELRESKTNLVIQNKSGFLLQKRMNLSRYFQKVFLLPRKTIINCKRSNIEIGFDTFEITNLKYKI